MNKFDMCILSFTMVRPTLRRLTAAAYNTGRKYGKAAAGAAAAYAVQRTAQYAVNQVDNARQYALNRIGTAMSGGKVVKKRKVSGSVFNNTRRQLFPKRRSYGAAMSKSSGFLKTPYRKRGRKRATKFERYGVMETIERGGVVDGGVNDANVGNTVAVGHMTFPQARVARLLWIAIVKHLIIKAGVSTLTSLTDAIEGLVAGDKITVSYYASPDSGSLASYTHTAVAGDSVWSIGVALQSWAALQTNMQNAEVYQISYQAFAATSALPYTVVNLRLCKVYYKAKSTLKIQNRTISTTGGDEESVDNVPLYGKIYFGMGTGAIAMTRDNAYTTAARDFIGDDTVGAIAKVPTEKWYQEPVGPEHFTNCKRFGKVHLDPGHIKTSVLNTYKVMSLSKMIRELYSIDAANLTHEHSWIGVYRFMLLEKMLNTVAGSTTNSIKIGYEVNMNFGVYITVGKNTYSAPLNSVSNIANES